MPFSAEVELRLGEPRSQVRGRAINISEHGLFVATPSPPAIETAVAFEVRAADGSSILRGRGEVVWARFAEVGPGRPAGVAIRFETLDHQSRQRLPAFLGHGGDASSFQRGSGSGLTTHELLRGLDIDHDLELASGAEPLSAGGGRPARVRGVLVCVLLIVVCASAVLVIRTCLDRQPAATGSAPTGSLTPPEPEASETSSSEVSTRTLSPTETELNLGSRQRRQSGDAGPAGPVPPVAAEEAAPGSPAGSVGVPARAIRRITIAHEGDVTMVTLEADGAVEPTSVRHFTMADPPRLVLRFRGILERFPRYRVAADTPLLEGVRVSLHEEVSPSELAVVLDLVDSSVGLVDLSVSGSTIELSLTRGGGARE